MFSTRWLALNSPPPFVLPRSSLDVSQVIGWLNPLDLLHIARVSKDLRNLLMSKDNNRLWKAARRNVPGLPDCPSVLSEPRYAAYIFDQYCFVSILIGIRLSFSQWFFTALWGWPLDVRRLSPRTAFLWRMLQARVSGKHRRVDSRAHRDPRCRLTTFKPKCLRNFPEPLREEVTDCCIGALNEQGCIYFPKVFWEVEALALTEKLRPLYLSHDRAVVEKVLDEYRAFADAMCQVSIIVDPPHIIIIYICSTET